MSPPRGDELHLWRGSLDRLPCRTDALSPEEAERAATFRFPRDRDRYIAGRAALRSVLASYLDADPAAVELATTDLGKPYLPGGELLFNLSHSDHHVVLAVTSTVEIGIDIEVIAEVADALSIAARFFSPEERDRLRATATTGRDRAFLECWTRKEAVVKARGDGLTLPLDAFDVGFGPGSPCAVLRTGWDAAERATWRLEDVSDPDGAYVGAVAGRGGQWHRVEHDFRTMCFDEPRSSYETTARR